MLAPAGMPPSIAGLDYRVCARGRESLGGTGRLRSAWGMSAFFQLAYLVGFKPWDSGVPPPELVEVVEGPQALEPGRALDLGCGTGTNCIYLAEHGWDATGVDFVG